MLFNGVRKNVLYRQAIMRKPPNNGVGYIIDLAEITIPGGVIRIDRSRLAFEYELTLGHYGIPHLDGKEAVVEIMEKDDRQIITAATDGRKVALIAYRGWDGLKRIIHNNRNAEADESTVVFAHKKRMVKNPSMELMITAMLHKTDNSDWTEEELAPVKNIDVQEITEGLSPLGAVITLQNDEVYQVDFKDIDGNRTC